MFKKSAYLISLMLIIIMFTGCNSTEVSSTPVSKIAGKTLHISVDNGVEIFGEEITFNDDGYALITDDFGNLYLGIWYYNIYDEVVVENLYYIDEIGDVYDIVDPAIQSFMFNSSGDDCDTSIPYQMYTADSYYNVMIDNIWEDTFGNEVIIWDALNEIIDPNYFIEDTYFDFVSLGGLNFTIAPALR